MKIRINDYYTLRMVCWDIHCKKLDALMAFQLLNNRMCFFRLHEGIRKKDRYLITKLEKAVCKRMDDRIHLRMKNAN